MSPRRSVVSHCVALATTLALAACEPVMIGSSGNSSRDPTARGGANGGAAGAAAGSPGGGGAVTAAGASGSGAAAGSLASHGGASGAAGASGAGGDEPAPCTDGLLAIRGRITTPRGVPLRDIAVTLGGGVRATTTTDLDGRYAFVALCAGRDYQVTPSAPELAFCSESAAVLALRHDVVEDFTGSSGGCASPAHQPRVLALIFDPFITGVRSERLSVARDWHDPATLAEGLARAVTAATNGRVRPRLVEKRVLASFPVKVGGIQYSESEYLDCVDHQRGCITADTADYASLLRTQRICSTAREGDLDEVWMFGGPYFGFWDAQLVGRPPIPWGVPPIEDDWCPRLVPVSGYSYEVGLDAALLTLMRRVELAMAEAYGGWEQNRAESAFEQFALVAAQSPDFGYSGCGSATFAPNGAGAWDFGSSAPASSHCDAFYEYPLLGDLAAARQVVTCSAWGCDGQGYARYWLGHLPRADGDAPDGKHADWWRYVLSPQELLPHEPLRCAAGDDATLCEAASDGDPGTCADVSSAPNGALGWFELAFDPPRRVGAVTLRAGGCSGRILGGRLAFSDGSPSEPFPALADEGDEATTVTFPEKELTWLRVVIDQAQGLPTVALGEITVAP
ncbi:MAG TPA: carboxypeptidase-like regulatory domain-containing protein [Polyangiaceae bacterium]|nr:carboxypeptidase-like regulatory domain-containing protein [Polyangiaceae bacterium]